MARPADDPFGDDGPESIAQQLGVAPSADLVACVARVALAIGRGGGDHAGDVDSVHRDFQRLVRIAFSK